VLIHIILHKHGFIYWRGELLLPLRPTKRRHQPATTVPSIKQKPQLWWVGGVRELSPLPKVYCHSP